jgi:hypothetical protein
VTIDTPYDFTFTASALRLDVLLAVARKGTITDPAAFAIELGNGKVSTGKRMLVEFRKRLRTLTPAQVEVLLNGDFTSQRQMALLAACKTYAFITEFIVEVLREKLLVYDYTVTEADYRTFFRRKVDLHPELEQVTELTQYKMKQVTFKTLEQAGLINDIRSREIQPQLLTPEVVRVVVADDPNWLRIFLMADKDIKRAAEKA